MRALALRTSIAAMVTAGMLLGGAGIASATGSSSPTTTTSSSGSPTTTSPTTTTSAPTTTPTTTTPTTTTPTTTTPTTTTPTTTTPTTTTPTTTTPTTTSAPGPRGQAAALLGCVGEVSVVVTGTELADGTVVQVEVLAGEDSTVVPAAVVDGRITVTIPAAELDGITDLTVGVLPEGGDQAFGPYDVAVAGATDACTAEGTIALARDCTSPDAVLAAVEVTGLADGTYGIGVLGESPTGQLVALASADVVAQGGGFSGTLPLASLSGSVPLDGFVGLALVIDGRTLASVGAADVELGACVAPAPLPVAPVHPAPSTSAPATTPVVSAGTQPAGLARTGVEPAGLLLLAGLLLGLGGATTLVARRAAR